MALEPITRDATFPATPDELFDAFTVPQLITQWFADRADVDVRTGGWWTFTWPPYRAASGRYLTVDRPSHLVLEWNESMEDSRIAPEGGETHPSLRMDYTFTSLQNHETSMHILESGHADEESRATRAKRIDDMLQKLKAFFEKGSKVHAQNT